jgi:ubiquinone/menaquinone biosynthesis C-methylase UbiE
MSSQKKSFLQHEADSWFDRNMHAVMGRFSGHGECDDFIIKTLDRYKIQPCKILEVGSSAGYRLNSIKEKYPESEPYGIDPSTKAIVFGKTHYPQINLSVGTADKLPFEKEMFDVVIIGFVFYVVDRELLFQSITEIDRVLKNTGFLIIVDFFSEKPLKNKYAHISDFQAYSFKQRYEDIFTASHLYHLMDKTTLNHASQKDDVQSDFYDLVSVTLLKKDIDASYK